MVRVTGEPVHLGGFALPARCEVILCPYVSHRDPEAFDDPAHFRPDRWKLAPPSPFAYFPFGAGGHACIGKALAMRIMKATLAFLLSKYDVLLAGDQDVDWRLNIQFMPNPDPVVVLRPAGSQPPQAPGTLRGAVRDMIRLDEA
jgi:cytochrome P450